MSAERSTFGGEEKGAAHDLCLLADSVTGAILSDLAPLVPQRFLRSLTLLVGSGSALVDRQGLCWSVCPTRGMGYSNGRPIDLWGLGEQQPRAGSQVTQGHRSPIHSVSPGALPVHMPHLHGNSPGGLQLCAHAAVLCSLAPSQDIWGLATRT